MFGFRKRPKHSPSILRLEIGNFVLDQKPPNPEDLKSISIAENITFSNKHCDDGIYDAPAQMFIGHSWETKIGISRGLVRKIGIFWESDDTEAAISLFKGVSALVSASLGNPREETYGLLLWSCHMGSVVLQHSIILGVGCVNFFLTSFESRERSMADAGNSGTGIEYSDYGAQPLSLRAGSALARLEEAKGELEGGLFHGGSLVLSEAKKAEAILLFLFGLDPLLEAHRYIPKEAFERLPPLVGTELPRCVEKMGEIVSVARLYIVDPQVVVKAMKNVF